MRDKYLDTMQIFIGFITFSGLLLLMLRDGKNTEITLNESMANLFCLNLEVWGKNLHGIHSQVQKYLDSDAIFVILPEMKQSRCD